jgi:hypothetical protein
VVSEDKDYKEFIANLTNLAKTNSAAAKLLREEKGWDKSGGSSVTTRDRIKWAVEIKEELLQELIRERDATGNCPVCGVNKVLCDQLRVYSEPEHSTDREVEALEFPA